MMHLDNYAFTNVIQNIFKSAFFYGHVLWS